MVALHIDIRHRAATCNASSRHAMRNLWQESWDPYIEPPRKLWAYYVNGPNADRKIVHAQIRNGSPCHRISRARTGLVTPPSPPPILLLAVAVLLSTIICGWHQYKRAHSCSKRKRRRQCMTDGLPSHNLLLLSWHFIKLLFHKVSTAIRLSTCGHLFGTFGWDTNKGQ